MMVNTRINSMFEASTVYPRDFASQFQIMYKLSIQTQFSSWERTVEILPDLELKTSGFESTYLVRFHVLSFSFLVEMITHLADLCKDSTF